MRSSAEQVIGYKRPSQKPWLSGEALGLIKQKAEARLLGDKSSRNRLQREFISIAKWDRETFYNDLADDAEHAMAQNDLRYGLLSGQYGYSADKAKIPAQHICTTAKDIHASRTKLFCLGGQSTISRRSITHQRSLVLSLMPCRRPPYQTLTSLSTHPHPKKSDEPF